MSAAAHLEFAPPRPPGRWPSIAAALVAHLLLVAALTWGVGWKRQPSSATFEAEIWAAVPQEAAAKAQETPPPPPQPKAEEPKLQPREADIALEKEKKAKAERERQEAEDRKKADEDRRRREQDARRKAVEEEKRLEAMRQENLKRIAGLAGATGAPGSTGSALQSAAPSASYAGRIMARIKPNIVFPERDGIAGNPEAVVVVRLAPDGTIVSKRLSRSSGVKAWDEAVLRALDRTEILPRDVDGRVVPEFPISFRPKD